MKFRYKQTSIFVKDLYSSCGPSRLAHQGDLCLIVFPWSELPRACFNIFTDAVTSSKHNEPQFTEYFISKLRN